MRASCQHPRQNDCGHSCYLFSLSRRSRMGFSRFSLRALAYLARPSANSFGNDFRGEWAVLWLDFHRRHPILGNLSTVMMLNEELQLLKLYRTWLVHWRMEKTRSAPVLHVKTCCSFQRSIVQYDRSYVASRTRSLLPSTDLGTKLFVVLCDTTQSSSG